MNIHQSPVQAHKILWIDYAIWQIKLLPQKKDMMSTSNSVNTHLSLKNFKHSSNLCKILLFWILNLMLEFLIKPIHQISAVIDCSSSIVVHILIIEKNLNCLPSSSTLLCFSWCRRGHTHLKFHKLIIHSVIRTEFFMPLLIIIMITFFLKMFFTISSTSCTTCAALISVFNLVTERRNLKASLTLIWVKREASKKGRFRGKNSSPVRHCWSKHDHGF